MEIIIASALIMIGMVGQAYFMYRMMVLVVVAKTATNTTEAKRMMKTLTKEKEKPEVDPQKTEEWETRTLPTEFSSKAISKLRKLQDPIANDAY